MEFEFYGEVWYWRGPAPWYFVTVSEEASAALAEVSGRVSYGWGCIPVTARVGGTTWETSLFPRDGTYVVPVKARVRKAEHIELGDVVELSLRLAV